ncbi:MAG: hypothetical protein Kow0077_05910 [Anaerolineae bacterium]
MFLIYVASAQPKLEPGSPSFFGISFSGLLPIFPGFWEFAIKKGAHLVIFGVLAALIMRALLRSNLSLSGAIVGALAMTLCYAALDELHQSFVPGRQATLRDVGIDLLGAALFVAGFASRLQPRLQQFSQSQTHESEA